MSTSHCHIQDKLQVQTNKKKGQKRKGKDEIKHGEISYILFSCAYVCQRAERTNANTRTTNAKTTTAIVASWTPTALRDIVGSAARRSTQAWRNLVFFGVVGLKMSTNVDWWLDWIEQIQREKCDKANVLLFIKCAYAYVC